MQESRQQAQYDMLNEYSTHMIRSCSISVHWIFMSASIWLWFSLDTKIDWIGKSNKKTDLTETQLILLVMTVELSHLCICLRFVTACFCKFHLNDFLFENLLTTFSDLKHYSDSKTFPSFPILTIEIIKDLNSKWWSNFTPIFKKVARLPNFLRNGQILTPLFKRVAAVKSH